MSEILSWDVTDDNNTDLFPENMQYSRVNNSARAIQGALARWYADQALVASGSNNAFVVTTNVAYAGLDGMALTFKANHTITGAPTLNVNSLGATPIRDKQGAVLTDAMITSGQFVRVVYDGSVFRAVDILVSDAQPVSITVTQFGAAGDGVTDDSNAINAATDYMRTLLTSGESVQLIFPQGNYKVQASLNFTNMRGLSGDSTWTVTGYGAKIVGYCDGRPVMDFMNSQFGIIEGFQIYGDSTLRPRSGIQLARGFLKTDGRPQTASHITIRDVKATGYYRWAAFYNYASEVNTQVNCAWENEDSTALADESTIVAGSEALSAPYAAIFDSCNTWGCDSDYYTQTIPSPTATSMITHMFQGVSFYRSNGGCCIWMDSGLANVTMQNCYAACLNGDGVVIYLARYTAAGSETLFRRPFNWHLQLHMESDADETNSFRNAFRVIPPDANGGSAINLNFNGFQYMDHNNHCDEALFRSSTLMPANSNLRLIDADITVQKFRGTAYSITYTGDGVTTAYDAPFYFSADDQVVVVVDGVTKTLTTDYTVTGEGTSSASVNFLVAPTNGAVIEIAREGTTDDTDAGPPSEGVFAPASTWTVSGKLRLPAALSQMDINLKRFTGFMAPGNLTGAFTTYPIGSYWITSQEVDDMIAKGRFEFYGAPLSEYAGDVLQTGSAFIIDDGRIKNEDGTLVMPSLSADPTPNNGAVYYNTTSKKLRGCENGSWRDL